MLCDDFSWARVRAPMTGPLKLADGSVTSQGVLWNSDRSTGSFRPSADALGIGIGGIERLRVASNELSLSSSDIGGAPMISKPQALQWSIHVNRNQIVLRQYDQAEDPAHRSAPSSSLPKTLHRAPHDLDLPALLAPLMYAASNLIDKYALEQHTVGIADDMGFASMGSALLATVLFLAGSADQIEAHSAWAALLSGVLMNASYLLFAICLTKTGCTPPPTVCAYASATSVVRAGPQPAQNAPLPLAMNAHDMRPSKVRRNTSESSDLRTCPPKKVRPDDGTDARRTA